MKKAIIIALVCGNVALLAWALVATMPVAQAQSVRGSSDYVVLSGEAEDDYEVVYVLNCARRQMVGYVLSRDGKAPILMRGRNLATDFKRR